ncbi:hypothetical protein [Halopenitus persicus]|uniref:SPW repeat-containing protein n=1 Tax=Halopenitus persicus TaxID=1048396 RepID=A0A1H3MWN4_9EURY|nr:hypothetical protein [Halopenitus persicus]SDY80625.1 hypothetical protein SAMN05216564_110105 [Halopenitus persicus]
MTALHTLRKRIRPAALLVMSTLIVAATYFEFVYYNSPTLYSVALWIIVVPMLLASTVTGVRSHPLYQPLVYGGFIVIGTLQYLDGEWFLLAVLFVLGGVLGLAVELRNQTNVTRSGYQQ